MLRMHTRAFAEKKSYPTNDKLSIFVDSFVDIFLTKLVAT